MLLPLTVPRSANTPAGSTVTSATFTIPTGMVVGDLYVATVQIFNPSDTATVTASGLWTMLTANSTSVDQTTNASAGDHFQVATFTKVYSSGSGTDTICTWAGAALCQVLVSVVEGQRLAGPVDTSNTFSSGTATTSFAASGISTAEGQELVLAHCFDDQGQGYQTPAGWQLVVLVAGYSSFYKIQSGPGAIGSSTFVVSNGTTAADHTVTQVAILPAVPPTFVPHRMAQGA